MDVEFSKIEFERLVRGSFKHGWLLKRSNGFKAVIPRKRYFVLNDDCLFWFKKEKNTFSQKGALDLVDMKLTELKDGCLHMEKKSSGKVYILSGAEIDDWAKTLEATLLPLCSIPKELKLSDYGSDSTFSTKDSSGGKLSRKSTGASSGLSSALSSLPNSNASSLLDGESNPPTPQADLEDSSSLDDTLIGKPFALTKETLEKHNSTMESMSDVFLTKESLEKHNGTATARELEDKFFMEITRVPSPAEPEPEIPSKKAAVKSAISFFETLSGAEDLPRSKSERVRQRLFSKFGPETKKRLRAAPRPTSPTGRSIGGDSLPLSERSILCEEVALGSSSSSLISSQLAASESSLLSEEIARANLAGSRTLDDLADSLANMMSILGSMNDTLESETQCDLFLFERGKSLLPPPEEQEKKKRMPSTASEPSLLRVPSDRSDDMALRKMSSYRLSVDYRSRTSTTYTAQRSAASLISLQTADTDSVSSIPEVEDVDFEVDERFADIEEYIHSKLICKEPISMVELTNCFKGKRLPKEAFRKLYDKIRKRIEIDRRISRRQPENLSQLSLLYGHFVDLHSGEIEAAGFTEMLNSKFIQRKIGEAEMDIVKEEILIPMDFSEFTEFLDDLPSNVAFNFRLGLEEHVNAKSPLRRVNLRLSEVDLIEFEEDELTVKRSALSCVEKGWSLAKLGGETIFTAQEKFDFLEHIDDDDQTFDLDFIAARKNRKSS